MRRAERLFEIVQILRRTGRPVAARAIAEELEVSTRSIYRDIAALSAQRVPIVGEAGIGYVLGRGFDMPPLMLDADELDAVALGVAWVASRGEPELARAARDLLAKIAAVVPDSSRPHILDPATSVAPVVQGTDSVSGAAIRAAIRTRHKLAIAYRGSDGGTTERVVWPILLGYRDTGRILAAWCELRTAFRYFRTDRMMSMTTLPGRIPEHQSHLRARWEAAMAAERARFADAAA